MRKQMGLRNAIVITIIAAILFIGANALTTAVSLVDNVNSQQTSFYEELEAELDY